MRRYSELLYWLDYSDHIHWEKDEKGQYCFYDEELSVRARKSFENWMRENRKRRDFRHDMRHIYPNGEPPATTFEEALEIAKEIKPDIDYCKEFEIAYIFCRHDENIRYQSVTILKDTGNVVSLGDYEQKGLSKRDPFVLHEIPYGDDGSIRK